MPSAPSFLPSLYLNNLLRQPVNLKQGKEGTNPCSPYDALLQQIFSYDEDSPMQTNKKPTLELKANFLKTLLEWMVVNNLCTWFFLSKYYYLLKKKANLAILPKPSQRNLAVISGIKQYKFLQHQTLKKEIKKKTIETSCS